MVLFEDEEDEVEGFIIEHSFFHIHYLPPYHPELNYQEHLWHAMRYEEKTNVYFETISDFDHAVYPPKSRQNISIIKVDIFINLPISQKGGRRSTSLSQSHRQPLLFDA